MAMKKLDEYIQLTAGVIYIEFDVSLINKYRYITQ